ncbi:MAG: hypothetical protein HYZ91_02910 [Candidatus Omnitrophica bacterium]|nr:hypothetical protein [Candidatus Omnitrophota bacterium]
MDWRHGQYLGCGIRLSQRFTQVRCVQPLLSQCRLKTMVLTEKHRELREDEDQLNGVPRQGQRQAKEGECTMPDRFLKQPHRAQEERTHHSKARRTAHRTATARGCYNA